MGRNGLLRKGLEMWFRSEMIGFTMAPDTFLIFTPYVSMALLVLAHLIIAFGIASDASRIRAQGTGVFIFWPIGWFILGLFGGFIALGLYWVIHYSTLRR